MISQSDFLKIKELISESKEMDTESKSELLEKLNKSNISGYGLNFVRSVEEIEKETYPFNKNKFIFVGENTEKEIFKGEEYTNNFLFEGDNLESLKVLRETHKNGIDVIYIDPPYNTGNKDFVYNDSFVSNDDGFKHSKWLSFMDKRLRLARELMTDDGVIFISIDDNEQAQLKLLCDAIFGESNFAANLPRITKKQRGGQTDYIEVAHDYVIIYSFGDRFDKVIERDYGKSKISEDENGKYIKGDTKAILASLTQGYSKGGDYDIEYKGKIYSPVTSSGVRHRWLWSKERMESAKELGILVPTKDGLRMQLYIDKQFDVNTNTLINKDNKLNLHSKDLMEDNDVVNSRGSNLLKTLGMENTFDYSKPTELIKILTKLHPNKNATVLDFFAGSGTTGHAVLELNSEDGGNRNFILCTNNENNICEEVTYQRLSKVINGYSTPTGKVVDGIPANLNYVKVEHIDTNEIYDFSEVDVIPYIELKEGVRYNCVDSFEYCESKNKYVFLVGTDSDMLSVEEFLERSDEKEVVIYCNNISVRNKYVNTPYYLLFKSINEKDILSISKS